MAGYLGPRSLRTMLSIIFAGLLILIMFAGAFWLMPEPDSALPDAGRFSSLSQPLQNDTEIQKNLAVGFLENGQFMEAEKSFADIASLLPQEILAFRNLTIARFLAQESGQMDILPVQQAADQLLLKDSGSAVTHVLAGRIARLAGNGDASVAEFQRAEELSPEDPAIAWEVFQAARHGTESQQQVAAQALDRVCQLQPENLFLLTEHLLVQAESKDPAILSTLKDAYETLEWLTESVRMQNGVELPTLLDRAAVAVPIADWPTVISNVRILSNVLRPQPATQSDRKRIQINPLEFIMRDFVSPRDSRATADSVADDSARATGVTEPSAIVVSFQSSPVIHQNRPLGNVVAVELADMDLDGRSDLVVVHDDELQVLKQRTDSSEWDLMCRFSTATASSGVIVVDLDQDLVDRPRSVEQVFDSPSSAPACHEADPDVILFGEQGVTILKNHYHSEPPRREVLPVDQETELKDLRSVTAMVTSDLDHDGDLDLAISSRTGISLWANAGDGTFADISRKSQVPPTNLRMNSMLAIDVDRDLDTDVLLGSDTGPSGYLENTGHGRFRWQQQPDNSQMSVSVNGLAAFGNSPHKSWNLLIAGPRGTILMQTISPQPGRVQFSKQISITDSGTDGLLKWDYDNDGLIDVVTWYGENMRLFRGEGVDRFREMEDLLNAPHPISSVGLIRMCRTNDMDQDGDLDLVIAGRDGISLLTNQGGNQNQWLRVALRGEQEKGGQISASGRVNHYGVGSMLEVRAGQNYQSQIAEGNVTHFGLGKQPADLVRVLWTNGVPANVIHPQTDQQICELQTLKGSCPYLYTWNGADFEFFTDLLWSAPLGLQFAEGVYAPPRSWEYLRIPGDKLKEKDGAYHVQVTEELWEAAYFDQIRLLTVDHPADVDIYSNEKVGPAELATFKIHTVRNPITPATAQDQRGRDVLELVRHQDGKFLKAFDHKHRQGLTEEHFLELSLGPLGEPSRVMLFLTGWIYPTDTSINVALGQSRELKAPRPPSLWVLDKNGEWREAIQFMGFPGGKTKTIAVDLTGVFRSGESRLQIRTTAEIYWDQAFFTIDEAETEHIVTPLNLTAADLHYRGFSARIPDPEYGPETYEYASVNTAAHWPPMEGKFTRYGSVIELLKDEDDLLVVMGSGDEMTLQFAVPQTPVPHGWKRDFLMHNVGWDKDADLNTVYGQTVEPLPFGKMSGYPYRWDEKFPSTRQHDDYLQRYQTRPQFSGPFRKF